MITKVTKENRNLYNALFEKAGIVPKTLDGYFANLETLIAGRDYSWLYLPLDEPTFNINADTRAIEVPSDFKKNGISVKGDHMAEILYFTIDRYFDNTDLYSDSIKIVIQWKNAAGENGVTDAIFKDISIFKSQGKLLFGWAINDAITNTPGTIQFAVRFYKVDETSKQLMLSLSTLTTVAVIQPTLDFHISEGEFPDVSEHFNLQQAVIDRIESSEMPSAFEVATPDWFTNLGQPLGIKTSTNEAIPMDLTEGSLTLYAQAVPTGNNTGHMLYTWFYLDEQGSSHNITSNAENETYILSPDASQVLRSNKVYYYKEIVNGRPSYIVIDHPTDQDISTATLPNGMDNVYERVAALTITFDGTHTVTGEYRVKAQLSVTRDTTDPTTQTEIHEVGVSRAIISNTIKLLSPKALEILVPTLPAGSNIKHVFLSDSEVPEEVGKGVAALTVTGNTTQAGDKISYVWSTVDAATSELTPIAGAAVEKDKNEEEIYHIPVVEAEDRASYDSTFAVTVAATRNGTKSDARVIKYRVTEPAQVPELSIYPANQYLNGGTGAITVAVTSGTDANSRNFVSDGFIYELHKVIVDPNAEETAANENLENDPVVDTIIKRKDLGDDITSCIFPVSSTGQYYCTVTNIVGTEDYPQGENADFTNYHSEKVNTAVVQVN